MTRYFLTIFLKSMSEIAALIADRENALHIDRRSGHISNETMSSQRLTPYYEVNGPIQGRLANYFTLRLF